MYIYDDIDQRMVDERVAQFRDQTRRFLDGKLAEDDFRALRRNSLYVGVLRRAAHSNSLWSFGSNN
jgi:sulfite reductase (NADPH) hemoprotein beta-component